MKPLRKRIVSLLLTGLTGAALLTGCGSTPEKKVITCETSSLSLGTATFYMRYYEALAETPCDGNPDDIKKLWNTQKADGETYETLVKTECIRDLNELCLIKAHKKDLGISLSDKDKKAIDKNVKTFTKLNSEKDLEKLGIRKADIKELSTLLTYKVKAYKALSEEKIRDVSDEEAMQGRALYVRFPLAEGDPKTLTKLAEDFAASTKDCKTPETFRAKAKAQHLPCESTAFDRTTAIPSRQMVATLFKSHPGTSTGLVKDEDALYVAFYVTDFDKQSTALNKEKIRTELQKAHVTERISALEKKTPVKTETKVLEDIDFLTNDTLLKLPKQD